MRARSVTSRGYHPIRCSAYSIRRWRALSSFVSNRRQPILHYALGIGEAAAEAGLKATDTGSLPRNLCHELVRVKVVTPNLPTLAIANAKSITPPACDPPRG